MVRSRREQSNNLHGMHCILPCSKTVSSHEDTRTHTSLSCSGGLQPQDFDRIKNATIRRGVVGVFKLASLNTPTTPRLIVAFLMRSKSCGCNPPEHEREV